MISADDAVRCARCRRSCSSARRCSPASAGRSPTRALPPRPVRLDRARAGGRRRARHPGPRRRPRARLPRDQERRRASCSRAPASQHPLGVEHDHRPRRRRSRRSRACAPPGRELGQVGGQARRRRLRRGQRDRRAARPAHGRASRYEKHRIGLRFDAMQLQAVGVAAWPTTSSGSSTAASSRSGSSARELRSPSVQLELEPGGEARIVSTHDQILSGDSATSAAASRPSPRTRAPSPRRAGGSARCWSRPERVGRAANRLRRRAATRTGIWQRVRDRGQPAQAAARRTRWPRWSCCPAARTTRDSGELHRARAASPRHYVATDYLESPRLRALGHGACSRSRRSRAWPRTAAASCSTCSARSTSSAAWG